MNNITKLAHQIKKRDNPPQYMLMTGKIISLPELKIHINDRVILYAEDVKAIFDIYEYEIIDGNRKYKNLNKDIVLLPIGSKFIAIGVLLE